MWLARHSAALDGQLTSFNPPEARLIFPSRIAAFPVACFKFDAAKLPGAPPPQPKHGIERRVSDR
jgi:hypothetical protein